MKAEYDFSQAKRGAVITQPGRTRITIYLDNDILDAFRTRADEVGHPFRLGAMLESGKVCPLRV